MPDRTLLAAGCWHCGENCPDEHLADSDAWYAGHDCKATPLECAVMDAIAAALPEMAMAMMGGIDG